MKITFDPAKRQATLDNRGLDMALAGEVFDGPTLTVPSDRDEPGFSRSGSGGDAWSFWSGRRATAVGASSR
jgi:uncharacterized DUF497 family protein